MAGVPPRSQPYPDPYVEECLDITAVEAVALEENIRNYPTMSEMRQRILNIFMTFPYLSRSCIQIILGPNTAPSHWDPVLRDMLFHRDLFMYEVQTKSPSLKFSRKVYVSPSYTFPPIKAAQFQELTEKARLWDEYQAVLNPPTDAEANTDDQGQGNAA